MVIKDRGGKFGGRAVKAVGLTSGGLRCVSATRPRSSQGGLTAVQKSAEGIVGGSAPLKARTVEEVSRAVISSRPCSRRHSKHWTWAATRRVKPEAPLPKGLKPARREPASNARRPRGRRWKQLSSVRI